MNMSFNNLVLFMVGKCVTQIFYCWLMLKFKIKKLSNRDRRGPDLFIYFGIPQNGYGIMVIFKLFLEKIENFMNFLNPRKHLESYFEYIDLYFSK